MAEAIFKGMSRLRLIHPFRTSPCIQKRANVTARRLVSGVQSAPQDSWIDKFPTRQAKLKVPGSSVVSIKDVLKQLKALRPDTPTWEKLYHEKRLTLVVLATPKFAPWLEDNAIFIPRLLEAITCMDVLPREREFDVDVVLGCVDGISPIYTSATPLQTQPPTEGLTLLYSSTDNLLTKFEPKNKDSRHGEKLASLTLSYSKAENMDITLPLANTLFTNGRHSTLLSSTWRARIGEFSLLKSPVELQSLTINVSGSRSDESLKTFIPAVPLTDARPIVSGLGNIVRNIEHISPDSTTSSKPQPASKELESKVTEFIGTSDQPLQTIKVWALIIPQELVEQHTSEAGSKLKLPNKAYESPFPEDPSKEIGFWVSQGATFCRVLSGGGGWGAKAGLLSLDPELTYTAVSEAWLADAEPPSLDGFPSSSSQISALGNLAKAGSYIQFFTSKPQETNSTFLEETVPEPESPISWQISVNVGSVPSTMDDIPNASVATEDKKSDGMGVYLAPGSFGFVSESGMFLKLKTKDTKGEVAETKIDMPWSYIVQEYKPSEGVRAEEDQAEENKA